jgi:hypothetical protein
LIWVFFNITLNNIVEISKYYIPQKTVLFEIGDKIGLEYIESNKVINTNYPFKEANNRPWDNDDYYQISLKVKPSTVGRFVIFIKTISLPHTKELDQYPRLGSTE